MEWYFVLAIILVIIIFLYLFMIFPGGQKDKHKWLFKTPIAHRGYKHDNIKIPENSKTAFINAINKGYTIEIDLNVTKDDKVIVFHDENLKRMCGVDRLVVDLTLEEIKTLKLLSTNEIIMTLEEFLELVNDKVGLLIEFKESYNGKLEKAAIKYLSEYSGKFCIQAFQPSTLKWFKNHARDIVRGQLCLNYMGYKNVKLYKRILFTNLLTNFIGRPHFISYKHDEINNLSLKIIKLLCPLIVWTIDDELKYNAVKKRVDNVIFENLEL